MSVCTHIHTCPHPPPHTYYTSFNKGEHLSPGVHCSPASYISASPEGYSGNSLEEPQAKSLLFGPHLLELPSLIKGAHEGSVSGIEPTAVLDRINNLIHTGLHKTAGVAEANQRALRPTLCQH